MDYMFWVWLGVIVITAIIEFATMEIVSIWFTFGAVIPFILAAVGNIHWGIQIVVFVCVSSVLIVSLRSITKKFLLRNSNTQTNAASLVGQKHRMLSKTDFETVGSLKVNDVVWTAVAENGQEIEAGQIVEIVKLSGNKLIVKPVKSAEKEEKVEEKQAKTKTLKEKPAKKSKSEK